MKKNRTADISTALYFVYTNQTEHVNYKKCLKVFKHSWCNLYQSLLHLVFIFGWKFIHQSNIKQIEMLQTKLQYLLQKHNVSYCHMKQKYSQTIIQFT